MKMRALDRKPELVSSVQHRALGAQSIFQLHSDAPGHRIRPTPSHCRAQLVGTPSRLPTTLTHLPHHGVSRSKGILLQLDLSLSRLNCKNLISALSTNLSFFSLSNNILYQNTAFLCSLPILFQKHFSGCDGSMSTSQEHLSIFRVGDPGGGVACHKCTPWL